jgi:hypothetical protein
MTKFITFIETTGNTVAVNNGNIQFDSSYGDKGLRIFFDNEHYIIAQSNINDVI